MSQPCMSFENCLTFSTAVLLSLAFVSFVLFRHRHSASQILTALAFLNFVFLFNIARLLDSVLVPFLHHGLETDSGKLAGAAPYWTYLLCALGLFIYQSLDAIDGKQARRTNSCSPLGELFDHGCDSLSTVFMAVGASVAARLGTHPDWLFFCSFIGMFVFYCAHWQTYVSGVLRFGKVDVTEIQIALVIVFVLSAFGGATMWDYTIPILEIKLKILPVLGVLGGVIFSCSNYFHVILHGGVGKNGSTIAGTSVLSPGLHIGLIIILAIMIYKKSATDVFEKHPCLYTLMFGCVFAKVSQKLVIAHMTKSELHLQDTIFLGPGLLFLDQYFNNFIDEYVVLWIAMVISSFDMVIYFSALCLQISRHLHLNIFKTACHQAPEQVQVLSSKSHQNNMD
ncbi:Cholinephosphotransferase 1 [Plecturocebus cupreus]